MVLGDVSTFHRFARVYDLLMPAARRTPLAAGIARADREVVRVLDVAGGSGRAVRALAPPEPVVLDAARGMVRAAIRRGLPGIQADASALPLRDASVDAVLIVDALHHVVDVDGAIAEAERVLAPGGVLVIREFDPGTLRGRGLAWLERLVGFDSRFYRPDDLASRAEALGLPASVADRGFGYTVVAWKERGSAERG